MPHVFLNKSLIALAIAGASLLAAGSALAENLDFTMVNKTGYPINELYVSSAATNDWEEDVLGRDQLDDGERVDIQFDRGSKGCRWDLKVTYEDGEDAVWQALDLCSISKVTLRYDRSKGRTWAVTE